MDFTEMLKMVCSIGAIIFVGLFMLIGILTLISVCIGVIMNSIYTLRYKKQVQWNLKNDVSAEEIKKAMNGQLIHEESKDTEDD